jgi:sec-independent protein translocase protein TatA
MPFNVHPVFLLVLLAIVLIIFGPGKLPELGGAIGRSLREFRRASSELTDEVKSAIVTRGQENTQPAAEPPKAEAPTAGDAKAEPESPDKPNPRSL